MLTNYQGINRENEHEIQEELNVFNRDKASFLNRKIKS